MDDQQFDELVNEAWRSIPMEVKNGMENVDVLIESEPTSLQLRRMKVKGSLLGLFEGVPKTSWGQTILIVQPSKITIFRNPILHVSNDIRNLKITIHVVLMHEIAHYFGYNEDAMYVMDKKLRERLSREI